MQYLVCIAVYAISSQYCSVCNIQSVLQYMQYLVSIGIWYSFGVITLYEEHMPETDCLCNLKRETISRLGCNERINDQ